MAPPEPSPGRESRRISNPPPRPLPAAVRLTALLHPSSLVLIASNTLPVFGKDHAQAKI